MGPDRASDPNVNNGLHITNSRFLAKLTKLFSLRLIVDHHSAAFSDSFALLLLTAELSVGTVLWGVNGRQRVSLCLCGT